MNFTPCIFLLGYGLFSLKMTYLFKLTFGYCEASLVVFHCSRWMFFQKGILPYSDLWSLNIFWMCCKFLMQTQYIFYGRKTDKIISKNFPSKFILTSHITSIVVITIWNWSLFMRENNMICFLLIYPKWKDTLNRLVPHVLVSSRLKGVLSVVFDYLQSVRYLAGL